MKPNFHYANHEGASICQLNAKGYAFLNFVDGMFEEDTAFASFRVAGGTAEDWLRLLAELTEPESKLNPEIITQEAAAQFRDQHAIFERIFPVDAEFHPTPKET